MDIFCTCVTDRIESKKGRLTVQQLEHVACQFGRRVHLGVVRQRHLIQHKPEMNKSTSINTAAERTTTEKSNSRQAMYAVTYIIDAAVGQIHISVGPITTFQQLQKRRKRNRLYMVNLQRSVATIERNTQYEHMLCSEQHEKYLIYQRRTLQNL